MSTHEVAFPPIGAPARRALTNANIHSLLALSEWRKEDLLKLHGIGPKAIKILDRALRKNKVSFKH